VAKRFERGRTWHHFSGELFIPGASIEDLGAFQTWYCWHRNGTGESPPKARFLAFDLLTVAGKSVHQAGYEERHQLIPLRCA